MSAKFKKNTIDLLEDILFEYEVSLEENYKKWKYYDFDKVRKTEMKINKLKDIIYKIKTSLEKDLKESETEIVERELQGYF